MRFTRSWWSMLVRMVGVCPRGAQVRLSGETSEKPLSSIKTRVAPRVCHFFYMRPDVVFPMRDLFIVALEGAPLRFLATPSQSLQQIPDAAGAIAHAKQLPDQMRDAIQGPVIFGIAVGRRPTPEGSFQSLELNVRQAARMSRSTLSALTFGPFRFVLPASDALLRYADLLGHLLGTQATLQQVSRTLAATRHLFARSERSHAPHYRTSCSKGRTLIIENSVGLEVHGSLGIVLWAAATGHLSRTEAESALERLAQSSLWISARVLSEAKSALESFFHSDN